MTKNIAHRGYSSLYPENTMLAFKKAYEAGCDGIELDVQLTKDDIIVIIHDESIDRTSNGNGFIKDYTYKELLEFDFSGKFAGQYGKQSIPTLIEYLEWIKDKEIFTNIELKNSIYYYTHLEEKVIEQVKSFHLQDKILFSSFNNVSILKCKKLIPEIKMGFLTERPIGNAGQYVAENHIESYHPDVTWLTEEEVLNCKQHNIAVNVWIVNTEEDIQRMFDWEVDGIFTNDPMICAKLQKHYKK